MSGLLSAAIPAAASLLGSGINAMSVGKTNRKTRQHNEKMYNQQVSDNVRLWTMQNEYNSPAAQMQRLKDAGLNPNLVYGKGADNVAAPIQKGEMKSWTPEAPQLDRPEFIGGSKAPVVISEVLQTSPPTDTTGAGNSPQANMAGHGISVDSGKTVTYRTEEHGWIMCIMSILPKTAYQQGLPRMFTRETAFDYYWPSFAHLGEQPIKNKELYVDNNLVNNEATFGYTPRYAEYKYMPSRVSGAFKSSLAFWHLGRVFASAPALNATFITSNPNKRIFAVTSAGVDSLYCHVFNHVKARRPMPIFGTPTL